MKTMKRILSMLLVALLLVSLTACVGDKSESSVSESAGEAQTEQKVYSDDDTVKIAFELKALNHESWLSMVEEARRFLKENGLDDTWTITENAPESETDIEGQVSQIEDFKTQGYDGMILIPCDSDGVGDIIKEFSESNGPVVCADTVANSEYMIAYTGTDNYSAAAVAAQYAAEEMYSPDDPIKYAIIVGSMTTQTHRDRRDGFVDYIEEHCPNWELVAEQPADSDAGMAMTVTENYKTSYKDLDFIYTTNGSMGIGAANALGTDSEVDIVTFDFIYSYYKDLMESGQISVAINQRFAVQGYYAMEQLYKIMTGKEYDTNYDTGIDIVTPENLEDFAS